MNRRPRLLIGSLVVAAVASLAISWAIISHSGSSSDDVARLPGPGVTIQPPTIGTNAPVKGKPLPSLDLLTLNGTKVGTTTLLGGKPLIINVWGSTCGPCKKELPDFAKVQQIYGNQVDFVGVDYLPPSEHEEKFARDKGVQYELLYDGTGQFIAKIGIAAFPVTLFVKPDGTIVQQTGQLDEAKLTALIKSTLP